jgi:hypothetical protein
MKLSWGSHALANNVPPHVYVGAGMMPLSQVQRDRPPKSGAGKRKKNAAEGSEIETEEGYLVSISNPDGGDAGQREKTRVAKSEEETNPVQGSVTEGEYVSTYRVGKPRRRFLQESQSWP